MPIRENTRVHRCIRPVPKVRELRRKERSRDRPTVALFIAFINARMTKIFFKNNNWGIAVSESIVIHRRLASVDRRCRSLDRSDDRSYDRSGTSRESGDS